MSCLTWSQTYLLDFGASLVPPGEWVMLLASRPVRLVGSKRPTGRAAYTATTAKSLVARNEIRLQNSRRSSDTGGTVWDWDWGIDSELAREWAVTRRDRARGDKANWLGGQVHPLLGTIEYLMARKTVQNSADLNTAVPVSLGSLKNVHRERSFRPCQLLSF